MAGLYHEFLASLRTTGVAKSSHFQVTIPTIPGALVSQFSGYSRLLAMRCESTELPGRQLATQENRIYGPTYKTPYQSLYQEVTLNFIETGDFFVRQFFEAWINTIFDSLDNSLMYPNMYRTDVVMSQYGISLPQGASELGAIATWNLVDAFPTSVNQMPVAWTEDGFHRVAVTLAYQYYTITKPNVPKSTIPAVAPISPSNKGSLAGGSSST